MRERRRLSGVDGHRGWFHVLVLVLVLVVAVVDLEFQWDRVVIILLETGREMCWKRKL